MFQGVVLLLSALACDGIGMTTPAFARCPLLCTHLVRWVRTVQRWDLLDRGGCELRRCPSCFVCVCGCAATTQRWSDRGEETDMRVVCQLMACCVPGI